MSASGGAWDTLYTTPYDYYVGGVTWSPDDSKLALMMESRSGTADWFIILNAATGAVVDSIPVSLQINSNNFRNNVEWSRASSTVNKLAFVSHESVGPRICYISPISGSTPTSNNVSLPSFGTLTWSPNNSSVMYVHAEYAGKCRCYVSSLKKNNAQTTTTSSVDKSFDAYSMNWHR
jgi:Tol biopolymer transport system component